MMEAALAHALTRRDALSAVALLRGPGLVERGVDAAVAAGCKVRTPLTSATLCPQP